MIKSVLSPSSHTLFSLSSPTPPLSSHSHPLRHIHRNPHSLTVNSIGIRCEALKSAVSEIKKKQRKSAFQIENLTTWLLNQEQAGEIDAELTIVLSSISLACKQIASLLQRSSIVNLTGAHGTVNVQGEDQKKLDVISNEDVLITPFTCDRTGSGDAVVAGIMRKLTTQPEMYENQDFLERQLRFAIAAGIISQWTIGAVRGFPTESATQNLKEQVYVPSMW
ncbi:fructokinase-like 1 [Actinidia rufa]|uniref:Fructokinase-like 1 n=1 Tax=Actinidia rufa TaxID=165716 RepID=A0A7J0EBN6_9ERIC|nr:fructokinase-like 1 [Actinidia rufa]